MSDVGKRPLWAGSYKSWKQEYRWGKPLPVPRIKIQEVRASTQEEATVLLNIWMARNGQALGGLLSVEKVKD